MVARLVVRAVVLMLGGFLLLSLLPSCDDNSYEFTFGGVARATKLELTGGAHTGRITVLVIDQVGEPVEGAWVFLGQDGNNPAAQAQTTNREGKVVFSGLAGVQTITVAYDGDSTTRHDYQLITLVGTDAAAITVGVERPIALANLSGTVSGITTGTATVSASNLPDSQLASADLTASLVDPNYQMAVANGVPFQISVLEVNATNQLIGAAILDSRLMAGHTILPVDLSYKYTAGTAPALSGNYIFNAPLTAPDLKVEVLTQPITVNGELRMGTTFNQLGFAYNAPFNVEYMPLSAQSVGYNLQITATQSVASGQLLGLSNRFFYEGDTSAGTVAAPGNFPAITSPLDLSSGATTQPTILWTPAGGLTTFESVWLSQDIPSSSHYREWVFYLPKPGTPTAGVTVPTLPAACGTYGFENGATIDALVGSFVVTGLSAFDFDAYDYTNVLEDRALYDFAAHAISFTP